MASRQNANATATATATGGAQRHPKSSHPAGHFRDKTKYNNRSGRFANRDGDSHQSQEQQAPRDTYISQAELTEHLTAKLRGNKFVEVKTKEIKNDLGTLCEIDVFNRGLYRIGNGTFFTMKLHTVSHKSRVIYIRIIFNDDEVRNADMRINADAITQIFREIAPDTIESISITDVEDSKGNKHLAVLAKTCKGASLNYTYERAMEFVHTVDEKYGSAAGEGDNINGAAAAGAGAAGAGAAAGAAAATAEDMSADQIDAESALLEKKLKALQELKLAKSGQPSQSNKESSNESSTSDGAAAASTDTNKDQIPRRPRPSEITITVGSKKMVVKK